MTFKPWTFFLVAIAGWMNRQQQQVIEYLRVENRILREKLGHRRLILNESQKRRLAGAACKLGRELLRQVGTLFSPDTLLRWNRWFIARKYDGIARLDDFLKMTGREILAHAGTVSHEDALAKAQAEYNKYRQMHLNDPSPVEKHFIEAVEEVKQLEQQARTLPKPPRSAGKRKPERNGK